MLRHVREEGGDLFGTRAASFSAADFNSLKMTLSLLSAPDEQQEKLQELSEEVEEYWSGIISDYFQGFNHCIKVFSRPGGVRPTVAEATEQLLQLSQNLGRCKRKLKGGQTKELQTLHFERIKQTEVMRPIFFVPNPYND